MIDLDKLEELAQAATPGPWQVGNKVARFVYAFDDTPICECDSIGEAANREVATATYIAAANPAAVLELIETQRMLVEALRIVTKFMPFPGDAEQQSACNKAREALKKATGE